MKKRSFKKKLFFMVIAIFMLLPVTVFAESISLKQDYLTDDISVTPVEYIYYDVTYDAVEGNGPLNINFPVGSEIVEVTGITNYNGGYTYNLGHFVYTHTFGVIPDVNPTQCATMISYCTNPTFEAQLRSKCNVTCGFNAVNTNEQVSFRVKLKIDSNFTLKNFIVNSNMTLSNLSVVNSNDLNVAISTASPTDISLYQNNTKNSITVAAGDDINYNISYNAVLGNKGLTITLPEGVTYQDVEGVSNYNGTLTNNGDGTLTYNHNFVNTSVNTDADSCASVQPLCTNSMYAARLKGMCPYTCGYKAVGDSLTSETVKFTIKAKIDEDTDKTKFIAGIKQTLANDTEFVGNSVTATLKPWRVESTGKTYATLNEAYIAAGDTDTITLIIEEAVESTTAQFDQNKKITITSENNNGTVTRSSSEKVLINITGTDEVTITNIIIGATAKEVSTANSKNLIINSAGKLYINEGTTIRNIVAPLYLLGNSYSEINDGIITGNLNASINLAGSASFVMNSGEITNTSGGYYGSAISSISATPTVTINGGTISNNIASSTNFGGVLVLKPINIGGKAVINNNKFFDNNPSNAYILNDTNAFNITNKLEAGSNVGFYAKNYVPGTVVATCQKTSDMTAAEVCEASVDYLTDDRYDGTLEKMAVGNKIILGKPLWKAESTGKMYPSLQDAYDNASATDTLTLMDVTYAENLVSGIAYEDEVEFAGNKKLTITSESKKGIVTRSDSSKSIIETALSSTDEIIFKDIKFGTSVKETISTVHNNYFILKAGTITFDNVVMQNGYGEALAIRGTADVTLKDTTITGFTDSVSAITMGAGECSLTMLSGSINNNESSTYAGAIVNHGTQATINLYGGEIVNNKGTQYGGIISINSVHVKGDIVVKNNIDGNNETKNISLFSEVPVVLDGVLTTNASIGVYKVVEDEHISNEIVATGSETDTSKSAQYFHDDYTNALLIVQSQTNKKQIIFAPNTVQAVGFYINASDAKTLDETTAISKANATGLTASGQTCTIKMDSDDLQRINNVDTTSGTPITIAGVTYNCGDASANVNIVVVDDSATVSTNNQYYVNAKHTTITEDVAKTLDIVADLNTTMSSVGGEKLLNHTPTVTTTQFDSNIKLGTLGVYPIKFSVGTTNPNYAEITKNLTIVKTDSRVGDDVSVYADNYVTVGAKKAEYQTESQIKTLMNASGTIATGIAIDSTSSNISIESGVTEDLKNAVPGTYPIVFKVTDPTDTSKTITIERNFVVLKNPEAYGVNKTITVTDAKALTTGTFIDNLKDLVEAEGQSNNLQLPRSEILATISDSDAEKLKAGTLGQYTLKLEVGKGLGYPYEADTTVTITVVKDGSTITDTKNSIYAENLTIKSSDAAMIISELYLKIGMRVSGNEDSNNNPTIDIEYLNGSLNDITLGKVGQYKIKYIVGKGTNQEVSITRTLTIVGEDATISTLNADTWTIDATDKILSSTLAKTFINDKSDLKDVHNLFATHEIKLGSSTNEFENVQIDIDDASFNNIKNGKIGIYDIKFINNKIAKIVKLTIYDQVMEIDNETLAANNFAIKLSKVPELLNKTNYIDLAKAVAYNSEDYSNIEITKVTVNNGSKPTSPGTYKVVYETNKGTQVEINMLVLDDKVIGNDKNYLDAQDKTIDKNVASGLKTDQDFIDLMEAYGFENNNETTPKVIIDTADRQAILKGQKGSYQITFTVGEGNEIVKKTVVLTIAGTDVIDNVNNPFTADAIISYLVALLISIFAIKITRNKVKE